MVGLLASGCDNNVGKRKRPDANMGVVTGIVICNDTGNGRQTLQSRDFDCLCAKRRVII
jgi:hypothetical protein